MEEVPEVLITERLTFSIDRIYFFQNCYSGILIRGEYKWILNKVFFGLALVRCVCLL